MGVGTTMLLIRVVAVGCAATLVTACSDGEPDESGYLPGDFGTPGSGGTSAADGSTGSGGVMATNGLFGTDGSTGMGGMGGMIGGGGMIDSGGVTPPPASECCPGGDCLCRGPDPTGLTSDDGPHATDDYDLRGIGCVYYPTDAEPPFAAVAIADGYGGSGGCGRTQTSGWGPFYASHGIVAMIVETSGSDQPNQRGQALLDGIAAFKAEDGNASSPLFGKMAGRYGTSGFSMGGGGTTYAASDDPSLLTSVGLMAWRPIGSGVTVPTLFICGTSDGTASCGSHTEPAYREMPGTTPRAWVMVSSGHVGQPSAGGGMSGAHALAYQKVFLEGDERWRPLLLAADWEDSNLQ